MGTARYEDTLKITLGLIQEIFGERNPDQRSYFKIRFSLNLNV